MTSVAIYRLEQSAPVESTFHESVLVAAFRPGIHFVELRIDSAGGLSQTLVVGSTSHR
jgi:hypothetical protein